MSKVKCRKCGKKFNPETNQVGKRIVNREGEKTEINIPECPRCGSNKYSVDVSYPRRTREQVINEPL